MTKNREAILGVLEAAGVPLCVSEIRDRLDLPMDQVTVYRGLKYLKDQAMVDAFTFTCDERGTEQYFSFRRHPHEHFFHCESCHAFILLPSCALGPALEQLEREEGFCVSDHVLYVVGQCRSCREKLKSRNIAAQTAM